MSFGRKPALVALLWLAFAGCKRATETSAPSASASARPAPPPIPPTPSVQAPSPSVAPCRALRVSGDVQSEGASASAIVTMTPLDGASWLVLGERAELVVRHGESAREFSVRGPARVLPCRKGLEQVLLARGTFQSSKGSGVRPGAEVWVATPFGVIRYGDADVELSVKATELTAHTRAGQAAAEAVEGLRGATRGGTLQANTRAGSRGRPDPEGLARACEKAATLARAGAERVASASSEDLGPLTAAQMRERREARARCLTAEAALATLPASEQRTRLGDLLQHADTTWRGMPR